MWDTRSVVVFSYRRFGITYRFNLQGSSILLEGMIDYWTWDRNVGKELHLFHDSQNLIVSAVSCFPFRHSCISCPLYLEFFFLLSLLYFCLLPFYFTSLCAFPLLRPLGPFSPSSPGFNKSLWRTIQMESFLSKRFSFPCRWPLTKFQYSFIPVYNATT
jgi:hypothetical protein